MVKHGLHLFGWLNPRQSSVASFSMLRKKPRPSCEAFLSIWSKTQDLCIRLHAGLPPFARAQHPVKANVPFQKQENAALCVLSVKLYGRSGTPFLETLQGLVRERSSEDTLCLRRGLEGCEALCIVDDACDGSNGCHNGDQPAEGAQGLQCDPVRGEHLDVLLHNVHLDLHSAALQLQHRSRSYCKLSQLY